jgi:hypothetical protein
MDKESDFGNIEYKRTIIGIDYKKIISYASQMIYRVSQGNHNAYYYIGINDDGSVYGISESDLENTIKTFNLIVNEAQCYIIYYDILNFNNLMYLKFKISDIKNIPEHRILVLGKRNTGKNTFIGNCLYGCEDNGNGYSKGLVTKNNSSSLMNYYPIGYVNNTINNYNNCDDINDIKIKSDKLIYLINVPHNYKHIYKINFDECITLYFSKDESSIINNSGGFKINTIYMIQNDTVDDFVIINNICYYNNKLSNNKLKQFMLNLINKYVISTELNNKPLMETDHINVIDVIYSFSTKKYLLLVLSKVNNKNNSKIVYNDQTSGKISSIYVEGVEQENISIYNKTYTIIVDFNDNIYKLKGSVLFLK